MIPETAWLYGALGMCFLALVLLFFVVLKPRYRSVAASRSDAVAPHESSLLTRVTDSTVHAVDGVVGRTAGPFNHLVLGIAGIKMSPADFTVMVLCGAVVGGLFGTLLANIFWGLLLAVLAPIAAKILLVVKTGRRRARFEAQLGDTLMMLTGGLRAGHSVLRSLEAVAQESESPTAEEIGRVLNEARIGRDVSVALEESAARVGSEDFAWVAQAIQIHREVGGDLANVLDQVGHTIRERLQIKGQVRALSAEGKLSAYILVGLPIVMALVLAVINPGYLSLLVQDVIGFVMIGAGVVLLAIGSFWLSRTVKIKF
ncbi:type II secretion system protein F [Arthrobacter sp. CAU 1506]|uniref:type II secretion system F family protein n=1 Tax=Arthrobacter sp. CAU 1506 TaxID=2560052 RepID=UPI0010ABA669|nr:type II secretion system F family protein [Arthrobacter sp. CAU 1506]TJY71521.1 type II secretion system protein F [Arthrobacter sp. CAU 1506]